MCGKTQTKEIIYTVFTLQSDHQADPRLRQEPRHFVSLSAAHLFSICRYRNTNLRLESGDVDNVTGCHSGGRSGRG